MRRTVRRIPSQGGPFDWISRHSIQVIAIARGHLRACERLDCELTCQFTSVETGVRVLAAAYVITCEFGPASRPHKKANLFGKQWSSESETVLPSPVRAWAKGATRDDHEWFRAITISWLPPFTYLTSLSLACVVG